jgi:PPOX class probable F420-dependent enzyme
LARLSASARELFDSDALVHFVTLNADGSPQASVVWAELDGDEILIAHLGDGKKVRNIARDPRVALTVEGAGKEGVLARYIIVYGLAHLQPGGAPELLQRLARRYIGDGAIFPGEGAQPGHVIRVVPTRIGGVGPWEE